ncbi:MAG: nucleotidyltransferase family protein [Chitinophagaceae bacterium]
MTVQCDIVILAAGGSTRLGRPKQLLLYRGIDLLTYAIETALGSIADHIIVVLGANQQAWQYNKNEQRIQVVINQNWQEGIASSIRCGLSFLLEQNPATENVLFMTCDQPHIDAGLLDKLITLQKHTGAQISATAYAGTKGIPAVFNKTLFPELLQLKGDSGARKIIAAKAETVSLVDFPLAEVDIDTEADYQELQKNKHDH